MTLIEANRLVAFGLAVLIWLVQLVIYPAFADITVEGFRRWHRRYTRSMTRIVAPLMIAQVALLIGLLWARPRPTFVMAAALVGVAWLATARVAVPLHRELEGEGHDLHRIARLVRTNWIRTVAWTLAFLALLA